MVILIGWNIEKVQFSIRYISEIILNVYVFLPVIKRYIDHTKDVMEEEALKEEEAEFLEELHTRESVTAAAARDHTGQRHVVPALHKNIFGFQ